MLKAFDLKESESKQRKTWIKTEYWSVW